MDDISLDDYIRDNSEQFVRLQLEILFLELTGNDAMQVRDELSNDGNNFSEIKVKYTSEEDANVISGGEWYFFPDLLLQYPQAEDLSTLLTTPVGTVSDVYTVSEEGSVIFYIIAKETGGDIEESALRDYASTHLVRDRERFTELTAAEAEKVLSGVRRNEAANLNNVAVPLGYELYTSEYFPLNFDNNELFIPITGDELGFLEGIERNETVMEAIFSMQEGEIAGPFLVGDYQLVIELEGIRDVPDDYIDEFENFYRGRVAQYIENDITRTLIRRDLIFDNFDSAYDEFVDLSP